MKPGPKGTSVAALFLCLVLTAPNLFAQWSINPAVNNAICTLTSQQYTPAIATDGSDGAIIVWRDGRNGVDDIYAQKIDAFGTARWYADGIAVCVATGFQCDPRIIADGAGGAVVVWRDDRDGNGDIYAQKVNSLGETQWNSEGVVICDQIDWQANPVLVSDGSGGAIITWDDSRPGDGDIYAQRVNASGTVMWVDTGLVVCSAAGGQSDPTMTEDDSGGAIIAWHDSRFGNFDIYVQRINSLGIAKWTANGVSICNLPTTSANPAIVRDGSGGAIITWEDSRNGNSDIYAQRVDASGAVQWPAGGVAICTAIGTQQSPTIVADGSGGAIITWADGRNGLMDVFAQKIDHSGAVQWTSNGVAICTAPGEISRLTTVPDGLGGAISAWQDYRTGDFADIYAQRIDGSGAIQWRVNGNPITTAYHSQGDPAMLNDGSGGVVIAWGDYRNSNNDIYAQRVDVWGNIFSAPSIAKVGDVANDQGGKLRLMWKPSGLDDWPNTTIKSYLVKMGTRTTGVLGKSTSSAANDVFWQIAGSVSADWSSGYSMVVSTYADSGLQGVPWYYFQVIARTSDSTLFALSNTDSAFSIDNIPPVGVGGASASSSPAGNITLQWNKNRVDSDLMGYNIYRSTSSGFSLMPSNKLGLVHDTLFVDESASVGTEYYYRVAAQDVHGNQGAPSDELSIVALTLQLTSFTASVNTQSGIRLQWQTASETDINGFAVEKRTSGSTAWQEVGFVKARGTSSTPQLYSYVDQTVLAGQTAYRLKQVANTGAYRYSRLVEIDFVPTTTTLAQNYPNPFNPVTTFNYQLAEAGNVRLAVVDALGREVAMVVNELQQPGAYSVQWNASTMPSGVYFYRLQAANKMLVRKLMVVK